MRDTEYSVDALNVIGKFYRADVMVYVEGDDDVVFWRCVFEALSEVAVEVQAMGNCTELEKRITEIKNGTVNAIVARDSDYHELLNSKHTHPRVIYTYGHSIENTLHTADCVYEICKVSLRGKKVLLNTCRLWLEGFAAAFKELVFLDVVNESQGAGVEVLGDNCGRFLEHKKSDSVSAAKIQAQVGEVIAKLEHESLVSAGAIKTATQRDILRWLRGHVLESGVQKFVSARLREEGRKDAFSYEQLFTNAIHYFSGAFKVKHPHYKHYANEVNGALATFE